MFCSSPWSPRRRKDRRDTVEDDDDDGDDMDETMDSRMTAEVGSNRSLDLHTPAAVSRSAPQAVVASQNTSSNNSSKPIFVISTSGVSPPSPSKAASSPYNDASIITPRYTDVLIRKTDGTPDTVQSSSTTSSLTTTRTVGSGTTTTPFTPATPWGKGTQLPLNNAGHTPYIKSRALDFGIGDSSGDNDSFDKEGNKGSKLSHRRGLILIVLAVVVGVVAATTIATLRGQASTAALIISPPVAATTTNNKKPQMSPPAFKETSVSSAPATVTIPVSGGVQVESKEAKNRMPPILDKLEGLPRAILNRREQSSSNNNNTISKAPIATEAAPATQKESSTPAMEKKKTPVQSYTSIQIKSTSTTTGCDQKSFLEKMTDADCVRSLLPLFTKPQSTTPKVTFFPELAGMDRAWKRRIEQVVKFLQELDRRIQSLAETMRHHRTLRQQRRTEGRQQKEQQYLACGATASLLECRRQYKQEMKRLQKE